MLWCPEGLSRFIVVFVSVIIGFVYYLDFEFRSLIASGRVLFFVICLSFLSFSFLSIVKNLGAFILLLSIFLYIVEIGWSVARDGGDVGISANWRMTDGNVIMISMIEDAN